MVTLSERIAITTRTAPASVRTAANAAAITAAAAAAVPSTIIVIREVQGHRTRFGITAVASIHSPPATVIPDVLIPRVILSHTGIVMMILGAR